MVECSFFKAPHFGGFREEMPYPLLVDMAIHQFDLARDLIGSEPVAVYCESSNPGWSWFAGDATAQVTVRVRRRASFSFTGSWCSPGLETSWNGSWRVSGAGGSAIWDGDDAPSAAGGRRHRDPRRAGHRTGGDRRLTGRVRRRRTERAHTLRRGAQQRAEPGDGGGGDQVGGARVDGSPIAEVLDDAYAPRLQAEEDPQIRAVLAGWTSVHDAVGAAAASRRLAVAGAEGVR